MLVENTRISLGRIFSGRFEKISRAVYRISWPRSRSILSKSSIKITRTLYYGKIIRVRAISSAVWVFAYSYISGYVIISWQVDGIYLGGSITLAFLSVKNIGCSACIITLSIRIFTIPPD